MNKANAVRGNDGLVLLYEAAMLLEQKDLMKPNQSLLGLQQPSIGLTRAVSLPVALPVSKPIAPGSTAIQVTLPKARQFSIFKSIHKPTIGTMPMSVGHRPIAVPVLTSTTTTGTNGSITSSISFDLLDPIVQRQNGSINVVNNIINNAILPSDCNYQGNQHNLDALPTFGFGSTITMSPSKRLSLTSRSSHNELEKTRRAKLRDCIETLRDELPPVQGESTRMTMLSVLMRASVYMKDLEQLSQEQRAQLRVLERRRVELQIRRAQLLRMRHNLKIRTKAAATGASASRASSSNAVSPAPLLQQHQREQHQRLPISLQHRITFQLAADAEFARRSSSYAPKL